ncbi:MAG: glutamine--fructose-6-phosphate transaminase (isomerizing) [Gammaproteobacteria bacterium]|nr:glutamine--fructose-6-phosphate transaminase (isomerizing) [Gammaproteobacteria bacterium]
MCGIVGAIAERNVAPILLEGLKRLEYRGYDSAGMVVVNEHGLRRIRKVGKVAELEAALHATPLEGRLGMAHTRWATHGAPAEVNAHPHICDGRIAVVHNGIIENHAGLKQRQEAAGFRFTSQTDTEVIAHQVMRHIKAGHDLLAAVKLTVAEMRGAYAIGVLDCHDPGTLIAARNGSPLVIGIGLGEHFIASDIQALLPVTQRFVYLENGDLADLRLDAATIYDHAGAVVTREVKQSELSATSAERGAFRHFMLKEIYEQPQAVANTLEGRVADSRVLENILGPAADRILTKVRAIQIVACGTSFHAGLVARAWFEGLAGIPCQVEIASEFRYRKHVVLPGTLFITISQSGETADTLAALSLAKAQHQYVGALAICNVPESSLVRESELVLMTRAGAEIGVASTKAFTTQLTALLLVAILVGRRHALDISTEASMVEQLRQLPLLIEAVLRLDGDIARLAEDFVDKRHALFLGRGSHYPVAMEGALKLKEISYIHAEAYAAGELKHGPLALIDADMPVIAVAPNNELLEKLRSNLEEVRSRGGELYVFADADAHVKPTSGMHVLEIVPADETIAPILFTVPLQLLAYHTAVLKGTDVDQPRNLAKSVTVE